MYVMDVSISRFRSEVFDLVSRAIAGETVVIVHKGERVRVVPERSISKLSRLTPLRIINPTSNPESEDRMKAEMLREWEDELKLL